MDHADRTGEEKGALGPAGFITQSLGCRFTNFLQEGKTFLRPRPGLRMK
jgi:hypothetical protein